MLWGEEGKTPSDHDLSRSWKVEECNKKKSTLSSYQYIYTCCARRQYPVSRQCIGRGETATVDPLAGKGASAGMPPEGLSGGTLPEQFFCAVLPHLISTVSCFGVVFRRQFWGLPVLLTPPLFAEKANSQIPAKNPKKRKNGPRVCPSLSSVLSLSRWPLSAPRIFNGDPLCSAA